ncbi:hypothetical protein F5Y08DRAFT_337542 [Xylaria arbuscula]|nr:hypothetical protein F5Y08DRAFT_337542 [Xylaria arbuscula]
MPSANRLPPPIKPRHNEDWIRLLGLAEEGRPASSGWSTVVVQGVLKSGWMKATFAVAVVTLAAVLAVVGLGSWIVWRLNEGPY